MSEVSEFASSTIYYKIPNWFIAAAAFVLMLVIPWACWVSMTLARIQAKLDVSEDVRGELTSHLADPAIHHTLSIQLERLRKEVDDLRRNP